MGNGKWEIEMEGKSGQRSFGVGSTTIFFFGDGRMWASVAIGQLSMEGKSVLLVFFFFWHHGKNITEILLIFIKQN